MLGNQAQQPDVGFGWAYIGNKFGNCEIALEMMDQPKGNTGFVLVGNIFYGFDRRIMHRSMAKKYL